MTHSLKRFDVLVAVILTALSAVAFCSAFALIVQEEGQGRSIVRGIQPGLVDYAIIRGSDCVGWLSTNVRFNEDAHLLNVEAGIRVAFEGEEREVTLSTRAEFSAIGLHQGSTTTIKSTDTFIRLTTLDLDPMRINMRGEVAGKTLHFEVAVPGPLSMKEGIDRSFRLEYLHLGKALSSFKQYGVQSPTKLLEIVRISEPRSCEKYESRAFDVAPFVNFAMQQPLLTIGGN